MSKYISKKDARERSRIWYAKNRKEAIRKRRVWRHKNKKVVHEYSVMYRYTSKERYATSLWSSCKSRAKKKGISFNIDKNDIQIPDVCPVLGILLIIERGGRQDGTPTVDRIKPELGYVKGNVAIISWRANRLKNDAALYELQSVVKYMTN